MKTQIVMFECNICRTCDYYRPPNEDRQAIKNGWFLVDGKHYCGERCLAEASKPKPSNVDFSGSTPLYGGESAGK